jgi:hypothetical protein
MHSPEKIPLHFTGIEPCKSHLTDEERRYLELADEVSAVIAVENSQPLRPQGKTLKAIHNAISLHHPKSITQMLYSSSGWAAAAAMAMILFLNQQNSTPSSSHLAGSATAPASPRPTTGENVTASPSRDEKIAAADPSASILENEHAGATTSAAKTILPENLDGQRKLIQEIETLREKVADLTSRDSVRMAIRSGVSWPVIMKLTSPNVNAEAVVVQNPLLGAFLEPDRAVARIDSEETSTPQTTDEPVVTPDPTLPSAIPVYDPARDLGQILLNNVAPVEEGQSLNLWVVYDGAATPQQVGTFPGGIKDGETISFQLGSKGMIPRDFIITQDAQNAATLPNESNILLSNPPQP